MRKKFLAAILAALMLTACVPFISGCSASVNYVLSEDGNYYIASCSGSKSALRGELVIEEEYNELPVKEIAQEGFRGTNITDIVIPASIESVGMAAFANCNMLSDVKFANGSQLKEMPQGIFGYCGNLKSITLPQTVNTIGHLAFVGCEKLGDIVLPDAVEEIGIRAFEGCYSLSGINLPEGLKTIGRYAFYQAGLTEIIIPSTVADKQVQALDEEGKPKLDDEQNPVMLTVYGIGEAAFHTCQYLKRVVIMERDASVASENVIATLPYGVFGACTALEEIYLPSTLKSIQGHYMYKGEFILGHAFHHCPALKTVHFAGTGEQWSTITIENVEYYEKGVTFNNDAIIKAQNKEFNSKYTPQA